MTCFAPESKNACFVPTDGSPSEDIFHVTVYNKSGSVRATYLHDKDGATIDPATYLGGGTFSIGECEFVNDILIDCMVDDVLGDQTQLINFYTIYKREIDGTNVTISEVGHFEDQKGSIPYVPISPVDPDTLGTDAVESHGRVVLDGVGVWYPGVLVKSYSISVDAVGDVNTPPTFTDSTGSATELAVGDHLNFTVTGPEFVETVPIVTTFAGDKVSITYIELTG